MWFLLMNTKRNKFEKWTERRPKDQSGNGFFDDVNRLQDFFNRLGNKVENLWRSKFSSQTQKTRRSRKAKRRLTLHHSNQDQRASLVLKQILTKEVSLSSVKRDWKSRYELRVDCKTHGVSAWPCCQPTGHLLIWCAQWRLVDWFRLVLLYLLKHGLRSESQRRWPSSRRRTLGTRTRTLGIMGDSLHSMLNLPA